MRRPPREIRVHVALDGECDRRIVASLCVRTAELGQSKRVVYSLFAGTLGGVSFGGRHPDIKSRRAASSAC